MPDPCDAACVKIIIDGQAMIDRAKYLINVLETQEHAVELGLREIVTNEELKKLLALSKEQCDFSKLIEESANKTLNLITYILSHHADEVANGKHSAH